MRVLSREAEHSAMSKSLVAYFSQSGTTAQVAESIASGLRSAGYEVDLHNLIDGQPPGLDGYDLFGVGSPTYYYRPPFNVMDYVHGLPDPAGLPTFVFVLHGTYRGDAGNIIRQALARKGAREVGYFACHGADQYVGYVKQGYLFSADHPTAEDLARAEKFGLQVAAQVEGETCTKPVNDPAPAAIYRLERFTANRWLAEQLYSRLFRVNKDKCTPCGTCVQDCPTGNITEARDGCPVWGRNCLLCLSCELSCPNEAITSPISWPIFLPFLKYNVRAASQDPSIDHVRAKHSQGKIIRV